MEAMEELLSTKILATVEDSISICACFWFFTNYYYLKKKTIGLQMILTLSVSDFVFNTSNIFTTWCKAYYLSRIGLVISNIALRFSILWSTNIAIFLYKLLKTKETTNLQKHYVISLIVLFLIAGCLSVMLEVFESDFSYAGLVVMSAVTPIALILTTFYYFKSIILLGEYSGSVALPQKQTTKVLYLYAFVQLLTVTPLMFYTYISDTLKYNSDLMNYILHIFVRLTGFANAVVYFFQRVASQKPVQIEPRTGTEAELSMTRSVEDALNYAAY